MFRVGAGKKDSKQNISRQASTVWPGHRDIAPHRFRWLCDRVVAAGLLMITGPLIAFAALAIKTETLGPAFDKSECLFRGRRFSSLTLRTRVHDPLRPKWARKKTRVGKFLEYAQIDALPRLVNVMRGDMRLVDCKSTALEFFG